MKYNILLFFAFVCLLLPATSHGGEFVNLVGVPGIDSDGLPNLNAYINALYRLSISIAALLAVIKIVIAGAKYMLSDIVTHKEDAKKDIQGALIGLLIVIGAVIILNTINTDLTSLDLTIDTTNVTQNAISVQELIALQQQQIADIASSTNSREMIFTCRPGPLGNVYYDNPDEGREAACQRICRTVFNGQYTDVWDLVDGTSDTCRYAESRAAQCDPNASGNCCVTVNGATWNEGTRTCSGLTEARAASRQACNEDGRTWNEAGNYCSTIPCTTCNSDVSDTVGGQVEDEDIVSTQVTPITSIESSLGLGAGDIGETELDQISLYLEGTITAEQLEESLGAPIADISALTTLSNQLSCGSGNNGDTVGYSRSGDNVTFSCVDAIP